MTRNLTLKFKYLDNNVFIEASKTSMYFFEGESPTSIMKRIMILLRQSDVCFPKASEIKRKMVGKISKLKR